MPDIFDRISTQESPQKTSSKGDIFDRLSEGQGRGIGEEAYRTTVQGIKGIAGGVPLVAAADIALGVHKPKVMTEEAKQRHKEPSYRGPGEYADTRFGELYVPAKEETRELDLTSSGLIEAATGVGHPEGFGEKAALWAGYLRTPKAAHEFTNAGIDLMSRPQRWAEIAKSFAPKGKEASSAIGAGLFMQAAEEGEWGPMGQLAAGVVGSMLGHGVPGATKGALEFAKHPIISTKEAAARMTAAAARMGNAEKLKIQQELIKTFRESGIQADLGSITGSNLIKTIQARLASSGLVGSALDEFRTKITEQLLSQTKELANGLGEARFQNFHDLDQAIVQGLKGIEESQAALHREIYQAVEEKAKDAVVSGFSLSQKIANLEEKLKPGSVKSTEQSAVLKALEDLKQDIYDQGEIPKPARVRDLMNSKKGIQDKINYEVKGGAKQLLKDIVKEIDNAIMEYGKTDPEFSRMLKEANAKFGRHVATYRNKDIASLMRGENSSSAMAKMNSVQGIRRMERALSKTHEGQKLFNEMKRAKFDQIVTNNMIDGVTNQFKMGKFSNLLEKGKNRELIHEILGPQNFSRLERLQKSTGSLAESAQKFFNSSKSGTTVIDAAIGAKALNDLINVFMGNPWPLMKTAGGFATVRMLSRMITDPVFLKAVEDGMLAGKAGKTSKMNGYFEYATRPFRDPPPSEGVPGAGPEEEAMLRSHGRAEEIGERFSPNPLGKGRETLSQDITSINPEYSKFEKPEYFKEDTSLESLNINTKATNEIEKKLQKNSWDKIFPDGTFEKFYYSDEPMKLGDFLKDSRSRNLLRDVLDVPVVRKPHKGLEGQLGYYHPVDKVIFIEPGDPKNMLKFLHHEGWHAVQYFKGKVIYSPFHPNADKIGRIENYPSRNYPKPKDSFEEYLQRKREIAARKIETATERRMGNQKKARALEKAKKQARERFGPDTSGDVYEP